MYRDILSSNASEGVNLPCNIDLDIAIRALRKARLFIRVINKWGTTQGLPFSVIKSDYVSGDEIEAINTALCELGFLQTDLPASTDPQNVLDFLKD